MTAKKPGSKEAVQGNMFCVERREVHCQILQVPQRVLLVLEPGPQEAIVLCQTRGARAKDGEGGLPIPSVIALLKDLEPLCTI